MKREIRCKLPELIDNWNLRRSNLGETKKRLSQRKLAEETGLALTTIHNLYHDRVQMFDRGTMEALCKFFNCEIGDLLEIVGEE